MSSTAPAPTAVKENFNIKSLSRVTTAIANLVRANKFIKEFKLDEGSIIFYDSPKGYQSYEDHKALTREEVIDFMEIAANGKYDPAKRLAEHGHYDESVDCHDRRLRCNFFRQQGKISASIRCLPKEPPAYDSLGASENLKRMVERSSGGLVLITGQIGQGKSTTIASLIEHLNVERGGHILTLEDPIEYIFTPKKARISQRSVGPYGDVKSFHEGLLAAKRQAATVLLIGELRDAETVKIALQAAEAGALVFASTHSQSIQDTVDTLLSYFTAEERPHILKSLARTLNAISCQQLLPTKHEDAFVLAYEYLAQSPALKKALSDGAYNNANMALEVGRQMQTEGTQDGTMRLNTCLLNLVRQDIITVRTAMLRSYDKEQLAQCIGAAADHYL